MFGGWSQPELIVLAEVLERVEKLEGDPLPAAGQASTLYITQPLTNQILSYQRELLKTWRKTIDQLAGVAVEERVNRFGGYQEGDARGDVVLAAALTAMTAAATPRYERAFEIGQRLAVQFTGKSRLAASEVETLIDQQLRRNEAFLSTSLLEDLRGFYRQVLRNAELPPPETSQEVQDFGDKTESRLAMYALALWGLGHLAFGREMMASQKLLRWVVTSLNPCRDCPKLAKQSPYGPLNPLPTVPGLGETQCRTNCLCLLVEEGDTRLVAQVKVAGDGELTPRFEALIRGLEQLGVVGGSLARLADALKSPREVVLTPAPVQVSPTPLRVEVQAPHVEIVNQPPPATPIEVVVPARRWKVTRQRRLVRDEHLLIQDVEETETWEELD